MEQRLASSLERKDKVYKCFTADSWWPSIQDIHNGPLSQGSEHVDHPC